MGVLGSICVNFLCIVWLGFLGSLLGFSRGFNGGLQRNFRVLKDIYLCFFVAFSGGLYGILVLFLWIQRGLGIFGLLLCWFF